LKKGTDDSNGLDFKQISEAWSVLSKPDSRVLYDQKRNLNSAQSTVSSRESHDRIGFQVQRKNFENVQRRASSNWSDIQDKYKTEKWRKMTLQEKKVSMKFNLFLFLINKA
jgi:curved DNA-binding protein CbpA